jgi:hypothetical protein
MANAKEIRSWQVGEDRTATSVGPPGAGALFFREPHQPSSVRGMAYARCAGEQRVVVLTEIAAQLAELNNALWAVVTMLAFIAGVVILL